MDMTTKFSTTNFSVESLLSSNEGSKSAASRSLAAAHQHHLGIAPFSVHSFLASASEANVNSPSRSPSPTLSMSRQSPLPHDSTSNLSPRTPTSDRFASHQMAAVAMAASHLNAAVAAAAAQRVNGDPGQAISWPPSHLGFQAWLRCPSSLSPGLSKWHFLQVSSFFGVLVEEQALELASSLLLLLSFHLNFICTKRHGNLSCACLSVFICLTLQFSSSSSQPSRTSRTTATAYSQVYTSKAQVKS